MDGDGATELILRRFGELSACPRQSGAEARARAYLESWASSRGHDLRRDQVGNLLVKVPASPGAAGAPGVVLQGHIDMVCEKTPDSTHDFSRDPIVPRREGDWLSASGTTLGADNGIGVAMAMAAAESTAILHPPLELLFTVEEETGLKGAAALEPGFLVGKALINLDAESEGVLTVGCAGGEDAILSLRITREPAPPAARVFSLSIGGLVGGHSGVDIHRGRANANLLLARALDALRPAGLGVVSFNGGSARNAIPRDATAEIVVDGTEARARGIVAATERELRSDYAASEPGLRLALLPGTPAATPLSRAATAALVDLLLALPNGVAGISGELAGIVETSNNVGVIRTRGDSIEIASSQRSSSRAALRELTNRICRVAGLAGASAAADTRYPPWQPAPASPLLAAAKRAWTARHGHAPEVRVIHAGLECASIAARYPEMDMISLGPTIEGAHSPEERLYVPSLAATWLLVADLLGALAGGAIG